MTAPADPLQSPFACCGQCGAQRRVEARYCWLCGTAQPPLEPTHPAPIVAELVRSDSSQRLAIWLGVVVAAIVGFGVLASQDWLWAAIFLIAVVPTLLVVLVGTTSARQRGQPWTPAKTAAVAVTTAATTVASTIAIVIVVAAVAVLVLFAAVIAMFQQCLNALGGGS